MSDSYVPDYWRVIKLTGEPIGTEPLYKIIATWSGSYLSGESWKINSGIVRIKEEDDCYDIYGMSGSVYRCYKENESANYYMLEIFGSYEKQLAERSVEMTMIDIKDILGIYK